ncbi:MULTISPECIES: hypothetical protein [Metallosphaera]|uniref:Uncharacterized protein n=3 Tax=Metallosphaera TaxID=41980 RepID=A4YGX4_METS5|nr:MULTISPECIES: hypothetical protein [Metallosphaera]ABP95676.1 hypothetical protein Msed_1520 [Metallosphaera sedula DSM 5348]AIM27660.1 hypothetical protein HA72_1520 [Metallosphaera sedula]AKV74517.1 hypothetical protein MsedA_1542 [Metallosphaera sedula]AKV76756.1 hypothetical protein MsedB_1544 [Metallosphaera sedula]AKV79007.1 hypothetical protein MsedC_1542 [Metallosphaera sedula]
MSDSSNTDNKENRTVTIRGVDSKLYERLVNLARETGKTVGEITNQAIGNFLSAISEAEMITYNVKDSIKSTGKAFIDGFNETKRNVFVVSNIGEITVFKSEIVSAGKPVSFRNIGKLILPDIDQDTLDKYVDSIISVDELIIPPSINKLVLIRKAKFVKRIIQQ